MNRKIDVLLLGAIFFLIIIGALMVFSSTSLVSTHYVANGKNFEISSNIFFKQLIFLFFSLIVLMMVMYADLNGIRKAGSLLWLISVVLLFLLPFLGRTVNGATRWYSLGGFSFNPAEPAKIALIIFLSDLLVRKKKNVEDVKEVIYPVIFILYIVVIGILMQKDLSTAILMVMLGLSMLYLAGARLIHISAILGVNFLVGLIMVLMFPYRLERIVAFFDPSSASPGALYQPTQSLIALGNGGLIGVGLGNSFQKYFFLPEAHTDYILSILGEEWGFLGVTVIMAIYFVIFWRGVKIARKCGDHFKSLLAWGITLNFVYYGLLHMMIVSHMVPSTGIGLPFMSYGGSALLVNSLLAGLLLNISADKEEQSDRFGVPEGWQDVEMEV